MSFKVNTAPQKSIRLNKCIWKSSLHQSDTSKLTLYVLQHVIALSRENGNGIIEWISYSFFN